MKATLIQVIYCSIVADEEKALLCLVSYSTIVGNLLSVQTVKKVNMIHQSIIINIVVDFICYKINKINSCRDQ